MSEADAHSSAAGSAASDAAPTGDAGGRVAAQNALPGLRAARNVLKQQLKRATKEIRNEALGIKPR